jgi:hypothetical protein
MMTCIILLPRLTLSSRKASGDLAAQNRPRKPHGRATQPSRQGDCNMGVRAGGT